MIEAADIGLWMMGVLTMAEFICVHEKGEERLINLNWVEEIRPNMYGNAEIYFAFNAAGCCEQDYITSDESYGEVKRKIWR